MKLHAKASAIALVTAALVGTVAMPAMAVEGSFTSSMSQVQPSFVSREWYDNNNTADNTTIKLTNCKTNAGGAAVGSQTLSNVTVGLYLDGSLVRSIAQACGTYTFGDGSAGTYKFEIRNINGATSPNRASFLNASVAVSY